MPTQIGDNQYVGDMDTFNCRDEGYEYGSVPVATGVNQLNETVYSCQDISGLFGGGLWDTWIGEWLESQASDDIDRVFRQQEAQAFQEILEGIQDGTKTWRDLQEFELDFLSEIPEMVEYYDRLLERTIYDAYVDDFANAVASGDAQVFADFVSEYENAGIKENLYATAPGPTLPPRPAGLPNLTGDFQTQMIKAICQGSPVCAGVDICFEPGQTDCIDPTSINDLWEDVVSHVYIVFGDLGIPIPDLPIPLPGILKLPTLGNIWEKIQTTVSDIANSEDDCRASVPAGENPDEYCSTSNRITRAVQNGSTEIITKAGEVLENVLGTVVGTVTDPVETAGKIWDWIKGAYGDDPRAAPPWVWQVIVASEVYGQEDVRDAIEDVVGVDIDDDGSIGTPIDLPYGPDNPNPDCTAQGLETAEDGTCVPATPEFGYCQDGVTEKADAEGTNCSEYAPNGYCEDGVTKKDNPEGTNCEEYEPPLTPEEQQCDEQGRVFNDITGECEETCANPEHVVGADGNCGPPEVEQTCDNGATNYPDCNQCPDGQSLVNGQCVEDTGEPQPEGCEAVDCNSPRPSASTFEGQAAYRLWNDCCGSTHCPDGSLQQEGFDCAGNPIGPEQCQDPNRDTNTDGSCADTCKDGSAAPATGLCPEAPSGEECTNGATNYPDCDQCPTGQSLVDGQCTAITTPECDQQDRVTNADGSCGECKPGFTPDPEGFDQCIQAPPECNDCSCAEYAAANPIECETGAEEPEPEDGEDDGGSAGGGGAVGGGGGRGMFQPYTSTISANPQLLARSEFPITDFLAGIFTNSRGGRNV